MRAFVAIGLVVAACGENHHPPALLMRVAAEPPAYGTAPFPTDAVRVGVHLDRIAGLEAITANHADLLAAHLAALDGWGLRPAIEFFVEGPIDPATVPATTRTLDDAVGVVQLVNGRLGGVLAFDWRYDADRGVVQGAPHAGVQLDEHATYAAFITHDIAGPEGGLYGGPALGALRHDPPAIWTSTADALALLSAQAELAGRLEGLTVFTTQSASTALIGARSAIASALAAPPPVLAFGDPTVVFDTPAKLDALLGHATRDTTGPRTGLEQWGGDNPTGLAHDHVGVVATGTITVARFRGADTGTDGPEDETFTIGAFGIPVVQSIDSIPVSVVLPKAPPPASGYPTIVYGHGLGGSRHDMLDLAEPLTAQGYAIVAIDMWGHGSRYDPTDAVNNLGTKPGFTGDPQLPDGFGDTTGVAVYLDFFESFLDIAAVRDSIRQSALDFARVAMLVQTRPALVALAAPYGAAPALDPTRVAYLGQSFGTLVGTELAAIEPSIGLYVLDVPGGGVLDQILPNSPEIGSLAIPLATQIWRTPGTIDRFHPLGAMMQAILDGADSLTYAPHVLKSRFDIANEPLGARHVVLIEAMHDALMPNQATDALARAFGVGVLEPDLVPPAGLAELASPAGRNVNGQTGILVQYEPATHGYNWSALHGEVAYDPFVPGDPFAKLAVPFTITEPIYETQTQVADILATYFAGQTPYVRSTRPPVADYDGDGEPDDVDPAPADPTR